MYTSVILIDSVYVKEKNYYPQVFLENFVRKKRPYFVTIFKLGVKKLHFKRFLFFSFFELWKLLPKI